MRSPILFLVFNRLDVTKKVFESIRKAQPPKLYVAADGPRMNQAGESERCRAVREIVSNIDWLCEVHFLFRDKNLGCKLAISSAIDWFFSHESEGIILEDDCLPAPSFFQFCDELLERFRDDVRVGMISGCNFQNGIKRSDDSYYFSRFCHIWGWATWARAWQKYDVTISEWPALKNSDWLTYLGFKGAEKRYWEKAFDSVYFGNLDTWDHQWTFSCWLNSMLSIMPNMNLTSNIGFGVQATHTTGSSIYANMTRCNMNFPLTHPSQLMVDAEADLYTSKRMFSNSIIWRILSKLPTFFGA